MKSFRWTFVFMIAVGALIAFTYWDYQRAQKQAEQEEEARSVVRFPTDQLTKVEILKRGSDLVLEKLDGKWHIVEPIKDLADEQAVMTLFLSFKNEKTMETVVEGASAEELKTYGLDDPVTRLKLTAGDQTQEVKIGSVKAYDSNLYAQIGDEPKVYLVSSSWDVHLAKLPKDLRDKHLIRKELKIDDVKKIRMRFGSDAEVFELVKEGENWSVAKGAPPFPVLTDKVKFYIDALKGIRAQDFVEGSTTKPADLAKHGLTRPVFEFSLYTTDLDKPYVTARFAKPDEKPAGGPVTLKAMSSDYNEVLIVTRSMLDSAQKPPENFYDKRKPFEFNEADVARVEVNSAKLKGVFVKKDNKWESADPDLQKEVDSDKLNQAIAKIRSFEAVRVLEPKDKRPVKKESIIKLLKASGDLLFELGWGDLVKEKAKMGRPEAQYLPVRTSQAENFVGLPEGELKALDLENWLKAKTSTSPTPAPSTSSPAPDQTEASPDSGEARIGEWKGSRDVRNPSEVPDSRRFGGWNTRFLAAVSLS